MKHLKLFFMMLLCCLTTTQLWANDGWVIASEPTSFAASTPFAIKNVTKNNYLSTNGVVATFNGLSNDEVWVLEPTGEQVEGYDTYFIKSVKEGKYWKDDDFNVSNVGKDGYDVHEYAGLNAYFTENTAEAMKVTVVATGSADNARAKDGKDGTEGYILTLSYETPDNGCGTPFKLGQQRDTNAAMEPYNEDVAWYFYAVTSTSKKDVALEMYKFESENVGTEPGQYSAASVDAYNAAVQAVKDATDATIDETIEALKVAYQGIAINPYFQVVTEGAKVIAPTDGSVYTGTVVIPATFNGAPVIALGAESFKGANVTIDMTNATNLKTIEGSVFNNCTVDVLDFSNTQLEVASGAGDNGAKCTVKTVYFPATLTKVDGSFLYDAGNLTDVYMYGKTPATSVGAYAFSSNPTFHVPETSLEAYQSCSWKGDGWGRTRNFVNDIPVVYTLEDVQNAVATYSPYLANVGENPGQYTTASAADLQAAVDAAQQMTEGATSDQYRAAVLAIKAGFEKLELVKGLAYIYNQDGTATVTFPGASAPTDLSGNAYEGDIVIPATVEKGGVTYNVTAIGANAFQFSKVTSLVIPEGIVEIGSRALNDMSEIAELKLPASLKKLGSGDPLCGNGNLKTIYFGNDSLGSAIDDIPQGFCFSGTTLTGIWFYGMVPPSKTGAYFMAGTASTPIHVMEKCVDAYKKAWPTIGWGTEPVIVGDIPYIYTFQDLQDAIAEAEAMLANVGTQAGQYKEASAKTLKTALTAAKKIQETAGAAQFKQYCGMLKNAEAKLEVVIGLVYNYFDNGTAEVTYLGDVAPQTAGANPYVGDIEIPATVEKGGVTYNVTKIGASAFRYSEVKSLVIPEGVTEIGPSALNDMPLITEINFPASLHNIGTSTGTTGGDPLCKDPELTTVKFGNAENGSDIAIIAQGFLYTGSNNVKDIWFYGDVPPAIGNYFLNCCKTAKIHVFETVVDAYKTATAKNTGDKDVVGDIPENSKGYGFFLKKLATKAELLKYVGTLPGFYAAEGGTELEGAIAEAEELTAESGYEAYSAALAKIDEITNRLVVNPITPGYYKIVSAGKDYTDKFAVYATTENLKWEANGEDEKYTFKFEANQDGSWNILNVAQNVYVSSATGSYNGKMTVSATEAKAQEFINVAPGKFAWDPADAYCVTMKGSHTGPGDATEGDITNWGTADEAKTNGQNLWYLVPAPGPIGELDAWILAEEASAPVAGQPFTLKNVTKNNYLTTEGGTTPTFNGLVNDAVWTLEATGEQVDGYDTYYIKSAKEEKYWKDDDFNVSNVGKDGYDVHEYAGLNAYFTEDTNEAMKVTVVANGSADVDRAKDGKGGTEGYIFTLSYETPDNGCGTPFKLGQQGGDAAMEPYNEDVAWYVYAVTPASKKDAALAMYKFESENVGTGSGQYSAESVEAYNKAVQAVKDATDENIDAAIENLKIAFNGIVKNLTFIFNEDGTATVTYPGEKPSDDVDNEYTGNVVIPETVTDNDKTYTVTTVGNNAFAHSTVLSVKIPNTVTKIEGDAMAYVSTLSTVYLGSGITEISQGMCWSSNVANVYIEGIEPLSAKLGSYVFSSSPIIHVDERYASKYESSQWATLGSIVGDIEHEYTFQDLQDAIAEAEAMLLNVGTEPGQYKEASAKTLKTALTAAKKIQETAGAAQFKQYCGMLKNAEAKLEVIIGFVYNYFDNGTAEVTYIGATAPVSENPYTGDMVIPDTVEKDGVKYAVTKIGNQALRYSTITSLVIPETVTEIGTSAMNNMTEITEINFPANFKKVGNGDPLCGCSSLKVVRFGNQENGSALDEISQGMCFSGTPLTDVYFYSANPPSKTGAYMFAGCESVNIHVLETAVNAYKTAWPSIGWGAAPNIVGDIEVPYTFQDVQNAIAKYNPYVEYADDVEGHYTSASAEPLKAAIDDAAAVAEDAGSSAFKAAINAILEAKAQLVIVPGLNYILNEEAATATVTYPGYEKPLSAGDNVYADTVAVPATVERGGKTYKVTTLGANCFTYSTITAVDFSGAANLTTIEGPVFNKLAIEVLDFRNTKLEVAKGDGDNGAGCAVKVVYFPATLKKIPGSFMWETSITDVYMYGEIPATEMGIYAFREESTKIHVPVASLEAYKACAWANNRWGNQARTFVGDLCEAKEEVTGTVDEAKIEELKDKGTKCIDLTEATIDTELDMTEFGTNVVAIVTPESGVTGTNVIVKDGDNYTCENLVLSDVTSFTADMPIHAAEVSVTKEIKDYEWYSLVLPYESAIAAGMEAFKFVEIEGSSMIFEKLEGVIPANTPVLTKMVSEDGESSVSFGGSDCDVAPADMSGLAFKGTYVTIPAGQATGKLILTADGKSFAPASEKASIPAFRCYFEQQDEAQSFSVVLTDSLTGAKSVLNGEAAEKVFNVLGIASEGFGVNVKGDKKYLK